MSEDRAAVLMSYQDALTAWVAQREKTEVVAISDVFVDSMDEGGSCGNDTCWFDAEVTVSFTFEDASRETRTYYISPGDFVSQIADIAKGVAA